MEYLYGFITYTFLTYLYEGFGIYYWIWRYKTKTHMILSFIGLPLSYGGILLGLYLLLPPIMLYSPLQLPFASFWVPGVILLAASLIYGLVGTVMDYFANWFEVLNLNKKTDIGLYSARCTPAVLILFLNNLIGLTISLILIGIFSAVFILWSRNKSKSENLKN